MISRIALTQGGEDVFVAINGGRRKKRPVLKIRCGAAIPQFGHGSEKKLVRCWPIASAVGSRHRFAPKAAEARRISRRSKLKQKRAGVFAEYSKN